MSDVMLEYRNEVVIDECIKIIKRMIDRKGFTVEESLDIVGIPQEEWEAYKKVIEGIEPIESLYAEFPDDFDEDDESSSS